MHPIKDTSFPSGFFVFWCGFCLTIYGWWHGDVELFGNNGVGDRVCWFGVLFVIIGLFYDLFIRMPLVERIIVREEAKAKRQ